MNCPRCQVPMHEVEVVGIPVDVCPNCDGSWYDAGELSELFDLPAMELHVSGLAPVMLADKPLPDESQELACPRCGVVMERFRYMQRSPVVVDGCAEHGIWLDDGELPKILEYVGQQARPPSPEEAPAKRSLVKSFLGLFYTFDEA